MGETHREALAPLVSAAPAVEDEPERAPALVEAAIPERAELPEARDQQGRPDDHLRVAREPR